jgi:hypothetical protein
MPNYKVYITVYHLIRDIEADSPEEAKQIATEDYIWDDHIMDSIIEAEEITDETKQTN